MNGKIRWYDIVTELTHIRIFENNTRVGQQQTSSVYGVAGGGIDDGLIAWRCVIKTSS